MGRVDGKIDPEGKDSVYGHFCSGMLIHPYPPGRMATLVARRSFYS